MRIILPLDFLRILWNYERPDKMEDESLVSLPRLANSLLEPPKHLLLTERGVHSDEFVSGSGALKRKGKHKGW